MEDLENIQDGFLETDSEDFEVEDDERLFDIADQLDEEILLKNIEEGFEPDNQDIVNYMTEYKERFAELWNNEEYPVDKEYLIGSLCRVSDAFLDKMIYYFGITLGENITDPSFNGDVIQYLEKLEALYEFFVCRHMEDLNRYFMKKVMQNKDDLINKFKSKLSEYDRNDLLFQADKKRFGNIKFSVVYHFIKDIIENIKAENNDGLELIKEIANMDAFEEVNDRVIQMLNNYGSDIVFINDNETVYKKYFAILENNEQYIYLRNYILDYFVENEALTNYENVFIDNEDKGDEPDAI